MRWAKQGFICLSHKRTSFTHSFIWIVSISIPRWHDSCRLIYILGIQQILIFAIFKGKYHDRQLCVGYAHFLHLIYPVLYFLGIAKVDRFRRCQTSFTHSFIGILCISSNPAKQSRAASQRSLNGFCRMPMTAFVKGTKISSDKVPEQALSFKRASGKLLWRLASTRNGAASTDLIVSKTLIK